MLTLDHLALRLIRLKPDEEWTHEGHGLCFVFTKGGNGKYVVGSSAQPISAGDVLVHNAKVSGRVSAADGGDLVFWCFLLSFEHLLPLFDINEICLLQNVIDSFTAPKFYQASGPMARECHRLLGEVGPQFNLDHRTQLLRVAGVILTAEFKTAQPRRAGFVRVEDHMIQVFEKLSSNDLLQLSVGELAARFSCSRRHLNRLFHQHFGLSVAALRMEMRLLKAVSLLRDPDVKIINVAEQCGFNHLGLFNTCFKRRFGETPGKWRKGAQGDRKIGLAEHAPAFPWQTNGSCRLCGKPNTPHPATTSTPTKPGSGRIILSINGVSETAGRKVLRLNLARSSTAAQFP